MDKVLFEFKKTECVIDVLKDYCSLKNKPSGDEDFIFGTMTSYGPFEKVSFPPKNTKYGRGAYFTNDNNDWKVCDFEIVKNKRRIKTNNQKHIKRHYGRPFSSISIDNTIKKIVLSDNHLIVRSLKMSKSRGYNLKFFKKRNQVSQIKINLISGNISTFKKYDKIKSFHTNYFREIYNNIMSILHDLTYNDKILFTNCFIDNLGYGEHLDGHKNYTNDEFIFIFIDALSHFFIDKKNIKVPDKVGNLLFSGYTNKRILKKYDNNLIDMHLNQFSIHSKYNVKLLNTFENINFKVLFLFCKFFGDDYKKYIPSIKPELFVNEKRSLLFNDDFFTPEPDNQSENILTKKEKINIIKIINDYPHTVTNHFYDNTNNLLGLFNDHIRMMKRIREEGLRVNINSITYSKFTLEHNELNKLYSLINRGWTTEYVYDEKMISVIESRPIKVLCDNYDLFTFKPVIFKREYEYDEESKYMHHCVSSYIETQLSLIVSLRCENNLDRVTIEYDKDTGKPKQKRYFNNEQPPEYFSEALKVLDERVYKMFKENKLKHIDYKRVKIKITQNEIKTENFNELEVFF